MEVDAEAVVGDLVHNNVIDEGDERDITSAKNPTRQNQKLHLCLRKKCTLDALMTVCDIMMAVRGNPKMLTLSEAMRKRLRTGTCCVWVWVCVCVGGWVGGWVGVGLCVGVWVWVWVLTFLCSSNIKSNDFKILCTHLQLSILAMYN